MQASQREEIGYKNKNSSKIRILILHIIIKFEFPKKVYIDSTVVGVMNSITSLYAGFAVFSMTGFLAQQTNRPVESVSFPRRKI